MSKNIIKKQKLEKVPITSIKPQGWMEEFLKRQVTGLTGNIKVSGYPFDTDMWAGNVIQRHSSHLSNDWWCSWWPFEQTSYYLDGANRVGHLLGDRELIDLAKKNMDFVMKNTLENGRIGAKLSGEWWRWPYASFNRLFMTEYEITGNQEIVDMLHKHYSSFIPEDFQDDLELANVEQLCWLYDITGDLQMLEMAEKAYQLFKADPSNRDRGGNELVFASDRIPDNHGVVYIELLKIPALLYNYTGKEEYWKEAMNGLTKMEEHFMLVSGLPSTTEHFTKRSELAGHETCNTATFPYTYGYYLEVSGDPVFADRMEKALYNASLGSITKDFKSHQYFSAPNQVNSTFDSNRFGYYNGFDMYLPGQKVECCTGNVNRFMPYFIEQMYLAKENGITVALYGPSTFKGKVKDKDITIIQDTNYPFEEEIRFTLSSETLNKTIFTFRVPGWCQKAILSINGEKADMDLVPESFAEVEVDLQEEAIITLQLPMDIELSEQAGNGIAIQRGPLVYALPIEAREKVVKGYPKSSKTFPAIERRPNSEWKYALYTDLLNQDGMEIIHKKTSGYPWDLKNNPISIKVPAQKIINWQLNEFFNEQLMTNIKTTPSNPDKVMTDHEIHYVELVPYGSTLLRLTIFPKAESISNQIVEEKTTETVIY